MSFNLQKVFGSKNWRTLITQTRSVPAAANTRGIFSWETPLVLHKKMRRKMMILQQHINVGGTSLFMDMPSYCQDNDYNSPTTAEWGHHENCLWKLTSNAKHKHKKPFNYFPWSHHHHLLYHRRITSRLLVPRRRYSIQIVMEDIFLWCREGNAFQVRLWLDDTSHDMNQGDDHGFSPLHWACKEGRLAIVEMLINRGARINATNMGDDTALHLSSAHGHRDVVLLLLKNKADVNAVNEHGKSCRVIVNHRMLIIEPTIFSRPQVTHHFTMLASGVIKTLQSIWFKQHLRSTSATSMEKFLSTNARVVNCQWHFLRLHRNSDRILRDESTTKTSLGWDRKLGLEMLLSVVTVE